MAKQTLMWTALPNGFTEDGLGLRVSLLLSPRLDPEAGEAMLKTFFPDFRDWPALLAREDTVFTVSYGGESVEFRVREPASREASTYATQSVRMVDADINTLRNIRSPRANLGAF